MHPSGIRNSRERAIQAICYEGLALLFVAPLFAVATGAPSGESLIAVACVAVVGMAWAATFNSAFDRIEFRLTARIASRRTHRMRLLHVAGLEASSTIVTWPVIWMTTGLGWTAALLADLGLTVVYLFYGYAFHLVFDRLRPVAASA